MTQYYTVEGQYELIPYAQKWAMPGWTGRYWDVIEAENEEDLAAYLSGQQAFVRDEPVPAPAAQHVCARCKTPCKVQFKYCYRCNQYNKVKAKLADTI